MTAVCPEEFTYVGSVNGCYKVANCPVNWTEAGRTCQSLHKDAHLLVINGTDEQQAVAEMLKPLQSQCIVYYKYNIM